MNSAHVLVVFLSLISLSSTIEIAISPINKFLEIAVKSLNSAIDIAQKDVQELIGFQNGSNNLNITGEILALPLTIKVLSKGLISMKTDLQIFVDIIAADIKRNASLPTGNGLSISVPAIKLEPYLNSIPDICNQIVGISHSIEMLSNIILAFVKPNLDIFTNSITGEEIENTAAVQYTNAITDLSKSLTYLGHCLLMTAKQSLDAIASSENGVSDIVLNTVNGFISQLGKQFVIFGKDFTVGSSIQSISSTTDYFHIKKSLILLNGRLKYMNTLMEKSHGCLNTFSSLLQLAVQF